MSPSHLSRGIVVIQVACVILLAFSRQEYFKALTNRVPISSIRPVRLGYYRQVF